MTESEKKNTLSAIERAKGHFADRLSGKLLKYKCDEWGIDVYYKATSSLAVENRIMSLQQQGKTAEALVESIIAKALNKDGELLFKSTDRATFLHEIDPNVIIKVATKLNNANADSVEDIVKN
tara:strand:+ start:637 stop:1005 length:369 start_codon:yes stop_codon:yes gene_type:complete